MVRTAWQDIVWEEGKKVGMIVKAGNKNKKIKEKRNVKQKREKGQVSESLPSSVGRACGF